MHFLGLVTLLRASRAPSAFPVLICLTTLALGGCHNHEPSVIQMVEPVYPITAQTNNVEGMVDIIIQVGIDGKVLSVTEGAEGANRDLVAAARENARQWVWGTFPEEFQFPWYHNIRYVFKLQGKRTHFPIRPIVRTVVLPAQTRLPNSV
jgi:hypothetical protein